MAKNKIKISKGKLAFNIAGYIVTEFVGLLCLLPFLMVISASFTEEHSIYTEGYALIPKVFSTDAYQYLFAYPVDLLRPMELLSALRS